MDPHDESCPLHPSSNSEVPHTVRYDQRKGDQAMARNIAAAAWKKSGWMTKISRAISDMESLTDKKQKKTNSNYRMVKA